MANPSVKGTANASNTTTVTIPTHAVGDLIVLWVYRDGSTTAPTKPSASGTVPAWVDIDTGTGTATNGGRTAYFVATATNHTSGTWTNASGMVAAVIQDQKSSSFIGGHARGGGTAANSATAPAITQQQTTGKSLLLYFYGHRTVTAWSTAPSGFTRQASTTTNVCFNTKDSSTSDGSQAQTNTATSSGYYCATVEILGTETSPTTALNSPADAATGQSTTPTLNFTGTDAESDAVEYNVQVHTDSSFGTETDAFTRADGALGSSWTFEGDGSGMTIVSNEARAQNDFLDNYELWNTTPSSPDYDVSADITMVHATEYADGSVVGRYTDSSNYYEAQLWIFGGKVLLGKTVAGTWTEIANYAGSFSRNTTYNIKLSMVGTALKVYVDGVERISSTDSDITTTGKAGIWATGHASVYERFDNFVFTQAPLINALSASDAGFTAGHPFASGVAKDYTTQITLSDSTTYYWRVKAIDPTGSNTYGAWATTRSFTTGSSVYIPRQGFFDHQ